MRVSARRPELPIKPLVKAVVASTSASRGQAFRCAANAESAASVSPAESKSKNAMWLASRADKPAMRELAAAMDVRAAASPRSSSARALAAWARAKPGSAAMARSKASIAPGYMVSFASQPST
jgi:hypothetical protein